MRFTPPWVGVRLLGLVLAALGALLAVRPRSLRDWTVRVNQEVFGTDTSASERRSGVVLTYGLAAVLVALGLYYMVRGAAGLPEG